MTGMAVDIIQLEKGWEKMKEGIDKFTQIMENDFDNSFPLVLHSELYAYPPPPPPTSAPRAPRGSSVLAPVCSRPYLQWANRKRPLRRTLTTWARRTCYAMCTQKAPHNCADDLYKKYGTMYEEQLQKSVLPAIKAKKGEAMLQEFAKRWKNHKLLVRQMWKLFVYLDRFYIKRVSALPLKAVGVQKFEQVVFNAVKEEVRTGVLGLIEKEREGEEVNRELLKSVVKVFVEIGDWRPLFPTRTGEEIGDIGAARFNIYNKELETGHMDIWTHRFFGCVQALLAATSEFYARESASWIGTDSCPEYMKKAENRLQQEVDRAENRLQQEVDRVAAYLHSTTEEKLLKECETQLLANHQTVLLEKEETGWTVLLDKEETGCRALLREEKTEDLKRMHKLFLRLPNSTTCGLQPISQIVREHIVDVGMSLVRKDEAEKDLVRKEEAEKDHTNYAQQLIDLHDTYLALVQGPFGNNTLFQKAFEVFVNKDIRNANSLDQ
ncbi:Cullin repeat-like-containing domain protein [Baffinella frigidus]|nr:Cullin repeat-like-containing domain protein [Cryptophyta sp. CCMP2293]